MDEDTLGTNRESVVFHSSSYGYIAHKHRLHAIIHARVCFYRTLQQGFGALMYAGDTSNAFPSIKTERLDKKVDYVARELAPVEGWFLKDRHRRACAVFTDNTATVAVLRLLSGHRQGDVAAAQKNALTFDDELELANNEMDSALEETMLHFLSPIEQKEYNCAMVRYADNL